MNKNLLLILLIIENSKSLENIKNFQDFFPIKLIQNNIFNFLYNKIITFLIKIYKKSLLSRGIFNENTNI
jgi:hypothetical protein